MTDLKDKNQMKYLEIKESINTQDAKYLRAKERIDTVKKFYTELIRSVVLIVFLAGLNYYINEWSYMWFLWAAFGIGIALILKAIKIFEMNPFFGKNWEQRKIKEFMKDDEQKNKWN